MAGASGTYGRINAYRILVGKSLGKRPIKRLLVPENESSMILQKDEYYSSRNTASYVGRKPSATPLKETKISQPKHRWEANIKIDFK